MHDSKGIAIFWDYENCPVPSDTSGFAIVDKILSLAQPYGSVKSFKAYLEISEQVQKSLVLRSELQSSGVSLIDCPHNGRKDVADKMVIVDMFAHAIDTPAPSTMLLITGDRDFAYAISILRLRRYRVILLTLSNAHASLKAQASVCLDWTNYVLAPTEAPVKVSNHLKQKSSSTLQEKLRTPDTRNPRCESVEIRHDQEAGFLKTIRNATLDRLAPESSLPNDPTGSAKAVPMLNPTIIATSVAKSVVAGEPTTDTGTPNRNPSFKSQPITNASPTKYHGLNVLSLPTSKCMATTVISKPALAPPVMVIIATKSPSQNSLQKSPFRAVALQPIAISDSSASACSVTKHANDEHNVGGSARSTPLRGDVSPALITLDQEEGANILTSTYAIELPLPAPSSAPLDTGSVSSYPLYNRSVPSPSSSACSSSTKGKSQGDDPGPIPPEPAFTPPFRYADSMANSIRTGSDDAQGTSTILVESFVAPPSSTNTPSAESRIISVGGSAANARPDPAVTEVKKFEALVQCLQTHRSRGISQPFRNNIAMELNKDKTTYVRAGVARFGKYTALAEKQGIIKIGGKREGAWIRLSSNWYNVTFAGATDELNLPSSPVTDAVYPTSDTSVFSAVGVVKSLSRSGSVLAEQPSPSTAIISSSLLRNMSIPLSPMPVQSPILSWTPATSYSAIVKGTSSSSSAPTPEAPRPPVIVPDIFRVLVTCLKVYRSKGVLKPSRTNVAIDLNKDKATYKKAGVARFGPYTALAKEQGIVELGGKDEGAWIGLKPRWYGAVAS